MLKFNEISDVKHNDFKEAMRIYEEAFPVNEREPIYIIKKE